MPQKIVIGPMAGGLKQNPLAFYIDNESFPNLFNAYAWRGRVKRKRGTSILGRLQRTIGTTDGSGNATITISPQPIGSGIASFTVGSNVFTDPGGTSPVTLLTNGPGTATLNRSSGVLTIAGSNINTTVVYFPSLPVMGLEDLNISATQFPGTIAFDTTYAYNIATSSPYAIKDVSFYKNPGVSAAYPGYTPKGTQTPLWWNGQDYQQFWTVNYQGALWETNGINVPFNISNIGMQFKPIITVTVTSPTIASLQITGHGLVVGDFVFINEVATTTGINFQTGYVITVTDANNVVVKFPNATIATNGTGGIAQYLTNRSDPTKDCLRWYDGDPTVNSGVNGWVNFMPPLSFAAFGIEDEAPAQYYLVGARLIINFKDRLLFLGPVIQTSGTGSQLYLQDTVIYSQNGTPFYTASFTGDPRLPTTIFNPILTPITQSASAASYFEDVTGFGGFISAGYASPILSVSPNEDTLIVGFSTRQSRLVYTGNDLIPFNFYVVNSELGTGSTFSVINLDRGVLSIGQHGIILSNQISSQRIDIDIPDQVFQINLTNQGSQRVTAQRDFVNEWVYFTYADNEVAYKYPNQTLFYNYREDTWAIFNESYTTYGQFRKATGYTWATIGQIFPTWSAWNEPWNAGQSTLLQSQVIAGNTQGFIVVRADGTSEAFSLYIQNIVGTTVTSPNHCLNEGDYIVINNVIGMTGINGQIFSVFNPTATTFQINGPVFSGTYLGGGTIQRMYIPFIQTKQFQPGWSLGRKTRLGTQQYLLSTTANGQVTLNIYLSQDSNDVYNSGPIVPQNDSVNDALIYSTVVYTCPESTNLGLSPANVNLQMTTAAPPFQQDQIWHRMNTSLIGDTVQVAITLNDLQMRDTTFSNQFAEIELHGFIIDISPSQLLA